MWAAVAPETRPVSLAGRTAYVLAQDMPGLLAAAPAQPHLLLLGPHDPYLDVHGPREKALLLPDAARHKAVWQTVSNPGVLLQAGTVAGVWRQSAQGKGLALPGKVFPELPAGFQEQRGGFLRLGRHIKIQPGQGLSLLYQGPRPNRRIIKQTRHPTPPLSCAVPQPNYAVSMALACWRPNFFTASSRILYLRILPAAFMGKLSTKSTYRGVLCLAM